ncbi:class I glutamine amidotransferase-like protein [Ceratobasidium sp. AG-I]|nr:class I glutamine amidotransferase-like protein [Ceratobasidium sp. AG-I]
MVMFLSSPLYAVLALFISHTVRAVPDTHGEGPIELLGILSKGSMVQNSTSWPFAPYEFVIDYVADTKDPIIPVGGVTQFQVFSDRLPNWQPVLSDFVRQQTPGLQYLLGVCTGSWILANAGVLEGKNATTNKAAFKQIKAETSTNINWIAKARWVVDGTTWTSSGVTAGMDMAYAFMTHLVGADFAIKARNTIELRAADQGDDPFAEIYGLLD